MKVYVAVQGCYSDQRVVGVYATPEAAMAANPVPATKPEGGWKLCDSLGSPMWSNGLDWDDFVEVTEFELEGLSEIGAVRESLEAHGVQEIDNRKS